MRYWHFTEDGIDIEPSTIQPGKVKEISPVALSSMDNQNLHDKVYGIRAKLNLSNPQSDKFKELTKSRTETYNNLGFDRIAKMIETQCSDYLTPMKENRMFLYRGVKLNESDGNRFFMGNSRTDRRPKDSDSGIQIIWDQILSSLNIYANRSNSIFTSSSTVTSSFYGDDVYLIFPLNISKFSWSATHRDIILYPESFDNLYTMTLSNQQHYKLTEYYNYVERYHNSLTNDGFSGSLDREKQYLRVQLAELKSHLKLAIKKLNREQLKLSIEMVNNIEKTGIMNEQFTEMRDFFKDIVSKCVFDIDEFQKVYKVTDRDFNKALRSKNEICISGHYIAIKEDFEEYFRDLWMGGP